MMNKFLVLFVSMHLFAEQQSVIADTIIQRKPKVLKKLLSTSLIQKYTPDQLQKELGQQAITISIFDPLTDDPKMPSGSIKSNFADFLSGKTEQPGKRLALRQVFTPENYFNKLIEPVYMFFQQSLENFTEHKFVVRMTYGDWEFPIHFDPTDNLFSQLYGIREILLVPYEQGKQLEQENPKISFDELKKKLKKYNGLYIKLQPGDCLFLPAGWYHLMRAHVNSPLTIAASLVFRTKELDYAKYVALEQEFTASYPEQRERLDSKIDEKNISVAR